MTDSAFGKRVKEARTAKRLTQAALAELVGCDKGTIWRIERGDTRDPRLEPKIAAALGWSNSQPMSGRDSKVDARGANPGNHGSHTMGQLVGSMQMAAGGGEDPYMTLLEVATKNDDPPAVFKGLAALRGSAPAGATHAWWFLKYQDMGGGAKRKQRQ